MRRIAPRSVFTARLLPRPSALFSAGFVALLALSGCGNDSGSGGGATQFSGGQIVCTDGATRCAGLGTVEICESNSWRGEPCGDRVCEDGACRARICDPGASACQPGGVAKCSARGTSFLPATACGANETCQSGACLPNTCVAGSANCTAAGLAVCRADGSGFDVTPCATGTICAAGASGVPACLEQHCTPGASVCDGGLVVSCDAQGLASSAVRDCAAEGKTCQAGTCVAPTCVPGVQTCMGGSLGTCAGDGSTWQTSPCGAGQVCAGSGCVAAACVPSESFCAGDVPAVCHGDGLGFDKQAACSGGQSCKQGACVGQTFVCGDGLCDGDESSSCPTDCGTVAVTSSVFDAVKAGTPTQLPRAPRALLAKAPMPWTQSRSMAIHAGKLFVVDADNGDLAVLDAATLALEATVPVGKRPDSVVVGPDGTVWVSVRHEAKLARLAWGAWSSGAPSYVAAGFEPAGLALRPDGKVLYVALIGEDVVLALDVVSGLPLARLSGVSRPRALLIRKDGGLVVTAGGGAVFTMPAPNLDAKLEEAKLGVKFPPFEASFTSTALRTFNPVPVCRDQLTIEARLPNRALSIAEHPETGEAMITHTLVANGSADDVLDAAGIKPVDIPQPPKKVCTGGYGSTCKIIPPPPGKPPCVGAPARPYEVSITNIGIPAKLGAAAPLATLTMGDAPTIDAESGRSFLARFDQPTDIAHHPTHSFALIAGRGSNNVLVVNTASPDPMRWPLADIAVGAAPSAIVVAPKGDVAFVRCAADFTVHRIELQPLLALAPQNANPQDPNALPTVEPLMLGSAAKAAYGQDPLSPEAQIGRRVFHFARNPRLSGAGRFACATCHNEGMEDKTVWFIAEGPRQTPALAGRLHDTAPYNWLGTKFKLTDNVDNTTARMGGSGLLPAELQGLAAFLIEGLVPPPNPNLDPGGLTAEQLEGKAIFEDSKTECSKCHVTGTFTDGAMHDVGTATDVEKKVAAANGIAVPKYNTPSLRGLFYTAPYLHDGSAPTLKDALKKTATTMGRTDHLTDKQLDALVAYLRTL
ncbi:MAG: hypothetical protein RIT45_1183 [Pseudomonadota bacterium]